MRMTLRASLLALALIFPGTALAGTNAGQPFPSNRFTVPDATQLTGLRVDLPKPDCAARPSDCADIAVLDTLDGFNVQPRISVRSRRRSTSRRCRARRSSSSDPPATSSGSTRSSGSR